MTNHDVKCNKCGHEYTCSVKHTLGENGQGYVVVAQCKKCNAYNGDVEVSFTWTAAREAEWNSTNPSD